MIGHMTCLFFEQLKLVWVVPLSSECAGARALESIKGALYSHTSSKLTPPEHWS